MECKKRRSSASAWISSPVLRRVADRLALFPPWSCHVTACTQWQYWPRTAPLSFYNRRHHLSTQDVRESPSFSEYACISRQVSLNKRRSRHANLLPSMPILRTRYLGVILSMIDGRRGIVRTARDRRTMRHHAYSDRYCTGTLHLRRPGRVQDPC
jgi:hypothetical protein